MTAKTTWPQRFVTLTRRDVPLAALDLGVVCAAYLAPLVLRFDGHVPGAFWKSFWSFLPTVAFVHLVTNYFVGLYGQMWRYASVLEARRVVLAGVTGGALVFAAAEAYGASRPIPRSVVLFGATLSLVGFGAIRFQNRLFAFRRGASDAGRSRVLLVGAGDAGADLVSDLTRNGVLGMDPVALVDDDPRKLGLTLRGVPVLGTRTAIPTLVERLGASEVLLAIPSATSDVVRDVASQCEEADVRLRVLPSVSEIVNGRASARDIRDLRIEDLLGRRQVETDLEAVRALIRGRRVLVTGAGGSIGAEIAKQVASYEPHSLVLLDHDETHLHEALIGLENRSSIRAELADIRDRERVFRAFALARPQLVFHAAAHKQVPILERHPGEAVRTNIRGTANVVDAAATYGVERFVLISTDKAIRPTSVMGASKWFAEQITRTHRADGIFCSVRFGNVLGSRGSVIPTFLRQIEQGGPVTVTDPEMARYFMSVDESVQLVLQAAALARGGEAFTLEMGDPINILDLAQRLIRLSGRVPGKDVEISMIGARPGEKMREELVGDGERPHPTEHPAIFVSNPPLPDPRLLGWTITHLETLGDEAADELVAEIKRLAREGLSAAEEPAYVEKVG